MLPTNFPIITDADNNYSRRNNYSARIETETGSDLDSVQTDRQSRVISSKIVWWPHFPRRRKTGTYTGRPGARICAMSERTVRTVKSWPVQTQTDVFPQPVSVPWSFPFCDSTERCTRCTPRPVCVTTATVGFEGRSRRSRLRNVTVRPTGKQKWTDSWVWVGHLRGWIVGDQTSRLMSYAC